MRRLITIAVTLGALTAGGCASDPELGEGSSAVRVAGSLPPPDEPKTAIDLTNYRIGPLDVIRVEVFGAPELAREAEVDAAGNFSLPLAGAIQAAGRTPAEFSEEIASHLRQRYLKNPQVSVNIVKAKSRTFAVEGAVREPGLYPIVGKLTLLEAIATARGVGTVANLNNVVIFRTVNKQKMGALFSLKDIRAGRLPDPEIYASDIVVVGESASRRFMRDFGNIFPVFGQFIPVL
ncbi:polysaccharide biosynthesis/export family protein [Sphingomonas sp. URHD0057]|uniref:polysaccharide biosynthesis/export family protein n=1 Tax=Sphingomonas sp. URHD0057 TaxID=1380389 RepID=UPI0018CC3D11|nr:polysaccharide biosynthesis/export family protein [Sphingomonas sp. URHD0057]